jgi:hypothetical protein
MTPSLDFVALNPGLFNAAGSTASSFRCPADCMAGAEIDFND